MHLIVFYSVRAQEKWVQNMYYLPLGEETKVHRREEMIVVNICGTLTCQEVLFS